MKHFQEILQTLGANTANLLIEKPEWDFWKAEYVTPVSTVSGYYLYLKHKCPLKEASPPNLSKWKDIAGRDGYEVIVTPRSELAQKISVTKDTFKARNVRTSKQLLQDNFIKDMKPLPVSVEEYFVEPAIEVESNITEQKGIDFLKGWLSGTKLGPNSASIAVLIADGGIGKTTVSRYVCDKIQRQDSSIIPILIESDQWKHLVQSNITMEVLWDLAVSRRFDQANRLLSNETALRALIQAGLFVVIFDGFDELCGSTSCAYDAGEVISRLSDITTSEDDYVQARILLTSRKTYWDSVSDTVNTDEIEVFNLKGFDNDKRKQYFEARLTDSKERDIANRLAREICGSIYDSVTIEGQNEDRPSGVPFVLDLIAQYVHGNHDINLNPYSGDHLEQLLIDICRRENNRQDLNIDAKSQLLLFEELFREFPANFTLDDLKLYLECLCNVTDPGVIQRFSVHSLLSRVDQNHFGPKYEVLRVYFIARFLAHGLTLLYEKSDRSKISKILAANSTGKTQVIDWLVRQLRQLDASNIFDAFRHAVDIINDQSNRETHKPSSIAIFNLAKYFVEGNDRKDRLASLAKLLCCRQRNGCYEFHRSAFSGTIKSYDFTNATFINCIFSDVDFRGCNFNETSKFIECTFEGTLMFERCDNANLIDFAGCMYSKEAEFIISKLKEQSPRQDLKKAFAEDALMRALKKFKSHYGYTSIQYRHKNSGFKNGNPYNTVVWEILLSQNIIQRHEISNVGDGGLNLTDDRELKREITTYMDNAVVGLRLKGVIDELIK